MTKYRLRNDEIRVFQQIDFLLRSRYFKCEKVKNVIEKLETGYRKRKWGRDLPVMWRSFRWGFAGADEMGGTTVVERREKAHKEDQTIVLIFLVGECQTNLNDRGFIRSILLFIGTDVKSGHWSVTDQVVPVCCRSVIFSVGLLCPYGMSV